MPKHTVQLPPALAAAAAALDSLPVDLGRADEHQAACGVCALPRAARREVEAAFVRWVPPEDAASLAGVKGADLRRHAQRYRLDLLRARCHVLAHAQVVELGMVGKAPRAALVRALDRLAEAIPEAPAPSWPAPAADPSPPASWEARVRAARRPAAGPPPAADPTPKDGAA